MSEKPTRAEDVAAKAARTREQLQVLCVASFCPIPHGARPQRPPSSSRALEERRRDAIVYEGERECAECQRKLSPMGAALVLLVLPPTATAKLVHAAKELRASQPMTWSAVLKASCMHLELALRRARQQHFSAAEYQAMASDLLATLRPVPPAVTAAAE